MGSLDNIVDSIRLCPCVGGDVSLSEKITGLVIPFTPISAQVRIFYYYYLCINHFSILTKN
jgi:hypothetical protein